MIGDDIVSDVGGAQACGIRGVQVRTGKYRYHEAFFILYVRHAIFEGQVCPINHVIYLHHEKLYMKL